MNTSSPAAREHLSKLAEALYRFSQSLDSSFAVHLKQVAVELAGTLESGEQAAIAGILAKAKGVIDLGERVGAIAASDVQVIAAAIARSRALALPNPARKEEPKQEASVGLFEEIAQGAEVAPAQKSQPAPQPAQQSAPQPASRPASIATQPAARPQPNPAVAHPVAVPSAAVLPISRVTISGGVAPSASDRQARIVAAIRQNPNVRMRDLLAALPGVSERTIRYDLERLVASGIIEREGVGGPATWYRLRESVTR